MTTSFSEFVQQLAEAQLPSKAHDMLDYVRSIFGVRETSASKDHFSYEVSEKDLTTFLGGPLPKGDMTAIDAVAYKFSQDTGVSFQQYSNVLQAPLKLFKTYKDFDGYFMGKKLFECRIGIKGVINPSFLFVFENFSKDEISGGNGPYTSTGIKKGSKGNQGKQGVPIGEFKPDEKGKEFYIGYITYKNQLGSTFSRLDYYNQTVSAYTFARDAVKTLNTKASVKALNKNDKKGQLAKLDAFTPQQLKRWQNQGVSVDTLDSSTGVGKDIAAVLKKIQ